MRIQFGDRDLHVFTTVLPGYVPAFVRQHVWVRFSLCRSLHARVDRAAQPNSGYS